MLINTIHRNYTLQTSMQSVGFVGFIIEIGFYCKAWLDIDYIFLI